MARLSKEGYLSHLIDIKDKLKDFIENINQGKLNYISDIALKLRILYLQKTRSDPLIETILKLYNFELKVFVPNTFKDKYEKKLLPNSLKESMIFGFVSTSKNWFSYGDHLENIIDAFNKKNAIEINGKQFSFKKTIETVADKMGGAHIDEFVPDKELILHSDTFLLNGYTLAETAILDTALSSITAIDIITDFIVNQEEDLFIKNKKKEEIILDTLNNYYYGLIENSNCSITKTINWMNSNKMILKVFEFETVFSGIQISKYFDYLSEKFYMVQEKDGSWNLVIIEVFNKSKLNSLFIETIRVVTELNESDFRLQFYKHFKREIPFKIKPIILFNNNVTNHNYIIYKKLQEFNFCIGILTLEYLIKRIAAKKQIKLNPSIPFESLTVGMNLKIMKLDNDFNFIIDYGINEKANRISLFVDKEDFLILQVLDKFSNKYIIKQKINENENFKYNNKKYLFFEVSFIQNHFYISLEINEKIFLHKKIDKLEIDFSQIMDYSTKKIFWVLASDLNGKANTNVKIAEHLVFSRPLTIIEKHNIASDSLKNVKKCMHFKRNQYFFTNNHPNFQNIKGEN